MIPRSSARGLRCVRLSGGEDLSATYSLLVAGRGPAVEEAADVPNSVRRSLRGLVV